MVTESTMKLTEFSLYKGGWINKHITKGNCLPIDVSKKILMGGGEFIRNLYNWDKKEPTCFWYVIKDEFGGIEELPSKARNQVRRSLKIYEFRRVPYDEMLRVGCELYNKSRERFGKSQKITQEQWKRRLDRDENSEFWIGYERKTGKPASFALNGIYEDYCDYATMGISPEFPNNTYPMYGLIYEMNRYYLEEREIKFVCDGARSITEHSNIQPFLEEKFKFRKAYCDLQIFYKPWFGVVVKLLFPFRKWIKNLKIAAVLRQEAWARGIDN